MSDLEDSDLSEEDGGPMTQGFVPHRQPAKVVEPTVDIVGGDTQLDEATQALLARILSNEEEEDDAGRPTVLCTRAWVAVNMSICVFYVAMGGVCIAGAVHFNG
jgi:hypothetical protein